MFTDESVKGQITDSISENLTDSNLKSIGHKNCTEIEPLFYKSESVKTH